MAGTKEAVGVNTVVARLWKWKLVAGIAIAVLGVVVLAWPGPSILVAATLFGVYLLISGVADMFLAFKLPSSVATRVLLFISGALSLVLLILSFRHLGDSYAVLLLSLWIGIGFIFQGVSGQASWESASVICRAAAGHRVRCRVGDRRLLVTLVC